MAIVCLIIRLSTESPHDKQNAWTGMKFEQDPYRPSFAQETGEFILSGE
jgi:hypothetical protein